MTTTTATTTDLQKNLAAEFAMRPQRSLWSDAWNRLIRNKAAVIGLIIVGLFILVAIFAPLLASHDPLKIYPNNGFRLPAWVQDPNPERTGRAEFLLGTDNLGRDVLSRVIYGARTSMMVGIIPLIIELLVGVSVGMLAGYLGGSWDNILMRVTDIIFAFPDFLFFVIAISALRDTALGKLANGMVLLFLCLSIVNWVGMARLVRGQVLSLKRKEFIEAARAAGAGGTRIMLKHLLPNSLSPIIVACAFLVPGAIMTEATLSYLGVGLRPAVDSHELFVTSWGGLLLDGQVAINSQSAILWSAAICVAVVLLAFTFVGDGLRDALDPRMKQ